MIVKNEAAHLEKCLNSVQGLVSEIWIADTGSQDATAEIAKRFTPHVWQIPWREDFAWARNQSMAQAKGDWILVLDADEWLTEETRSGLSAFLTQQSVQEPKVFNFLAHTPGEAPLFTRALFPNLKGFAFKGRVHETLRWQGHMPEHLHCPQWVIGHTPGNLAQRKHKAALYLPLIEAELAGELTTQEQADYFYHAGQAHVLLENPTEALRAYKQAYRAFHASGLTHHDLFYEQLLHALIPLTLELKQGISRALGYAKEYAQLHPKNDWAHYLKAHCYFLLQEYPLALTALQSLQVNATQELTLKSQLLEARCQFLLGERERSLQIFQALAQVLPDNPELHLHWARALYCQQKLNQAIQILSPFLNGPLLSSQIQVFLLKQRLWCEAEHQQIKKQS